MIASTSPPTKKGSPPRKSSPKGSPPRKSSPKGSPPRKSSPKGSPPRKSSPKGSPPRKSSPKGSPPRKSPVKREIHKSLFSTLPVLLTRSTPTRTTSIERCTDAYINKICLNLDSIYEVKNKNTCFRYALKGHNAIHETILTEIQKKNNPGVLTDFLKSIKLKSIILQELTIHINPKFNHSDYNRVLTDICANLFNSAYRILQGKTLENIVPLQYSLLSNVIKQPSWDVPGKFNCENLDTNYGKLFGFWEKCEPSLSAPFPATTTGKGAEKSTGIEEYHSYNQKVIRFVFDLTNKNNYIISLETAPPRGGGGGTTAVGGYETLLKIDIPTFSNKYSRYTMWKELGNLLYIRGLPVSGFIYNTIDTSKNNLLILIKLLSVYHQSLNIFTMERLSGIPDTQVLLFENGHKEDLLKWLQRHTYVTSADKYTNKQLKHIVDILQKKYMHQLQDDKCKIIISMSIEDASRGEKNKGIDQLEIDLDLIFNKDLYLYLLHFVKTKITTLIFKFTGMHTTSIVNRKCFLVSKLIPSSVFDCHLVNYNTAYEHNMIYFGSGNIVKELLTILKVDFKTIQENYNHKIVAATDDDAPSKYEYVSNGFLVDASRPGEVCVYTILLVNHIQVLYRMPIRIIKLKFIDSDMPADIQKLTYHSQEINISNQDVFLETLVETNSPVDIFRTLLFMKSLNSNKINYNIRQDIIPALKEDTINQMLTYQNVKHATREDILHKLRLL